MKLSEREFVERLARIARGTRGKGGAPSRGSLSLRQGIGDDCAVIASSKTSRGKASDSPDLLVTTDLFMEDIHFRRAWQPPASLGHKALARGLSDIAAMGGIARFAFLSLAIPKGTSQTWVNSFLQGLLRLAKTHGVVLAGGDTGRSKNGVIADIIVMGEVPAKMAVLRSGARAGDSVFVSGKLGGAAHALAILEKKGLPRKNRERSNSATLRPLFYPQPRLAIGSFLRERKLASAMIDLSDGLSIDLARLCKASNVVAEIDEASVPPTPQAKLQEALHGGEDHELLFTVPRSLVSKVPKQIEGVPLTRIGRIIASSGRSRDLTLVRGNERRALPVCGFQHF